MFELIDRLAGWWLNWRNGHFARKSGLGDIKIEKLEIDKGMMNIIYSHPVFAYLTSEVAAVLDESKAENFVTFDMQPRADHARRPITVTVQWANKNTPAMMITKLREEIAELTKKGESLCLQNGELLMQIHDLKAAKDEAEKVLTEFAEGYDPEQYGTWKDIDKNEFWWPIGPFRRAYNYLSKYGGAK